MKGTYVLILLLRQSISQVHVGRLGSFDFAAGYYFYVGSAFGPGGLDARLAYHRRRHKQRPHWHIDYMRPYALLREAWTAASDARLEQAWVDALAALPGMQRPIRGFGSSDVSSYSHLLYNPTKPPSRQMVAALMEIPAMEQLCHVTIEVALYEDDGE